MADANLDRARDVFAAWRTRVEGGEDLVIEDLCRDHPQLADALLHLHADWVLAKSESPSTAPPAPSLSAQLRALFGDGVDPGICLDPRETGTDPSLLGKLRDRDASSRYDVRDKVGQGGMGAVYRVFDHDLRRTLAMKVALVRDQGRLARFLEEAQVNGQLDHPGIVPVHELGVDPHGRVYFTMKLVRGETLDDVIDRTNAGVDGWSVTRVVSVLLRIAEAMAFAHEKRVIHRDLKPSNVMVGRYGEVYVMDWGLARVLGDDHAANTAPVATRTEESVVATDRRDSHRGPDSDLYATKDGDVVGTPAYMSPEQAHGDLAQIGPRTDVYSLGAMLYRLLAGHAPYSEEPTSGFEIVRRLLAGPPTPIARLAPETPAELLAICEKAMARNPTARYASMTAVSDDLRAYLENRVVAAYESGAFAEAKKWVRRNRGLAIAASLALAATVTGLAGIGFVEKRRRVEVEEKAAEVAAQKLEFDQLSGVVRLDDAIRAERDLFPAVPENLPAIERWLSAIAAPLVALRPRVEATVRELVARGASAPIDAATPTAVNDADRFLHATLSKLSLDLSEFESRTLAAVEVRAEWARRIESLTTNHPAARVTWEDARAAIARADDVVASRRYAEVPIDLRPQLGLVPLGMNPATKLWEFLELRSACDFEHGADPARIELPRIAADGTVKVDDSTGIIFVLVPGATFLQGAQSLAPNEPNYDPDAEDNESVDGKPISTTLAPFFIARHEMTQGQWLRLAGTNPSFWMAQAPSRISLASPLENVSLDECSSLLAKHGMVLPTEAQWEYACRGGTSTPYSFGADAAEMPRNGNVKDSEFARTFADSAGHDVDPFDDGYALPCTVGSYAANGFGLHDVHGNVMEWCRDRYAAYSVPGNASDGLRASDGPTPFIVRGGCYGGRAVFGRAADRQWLPAETRVHDLGCRPARPLATRTR